MKSADVSFVDRLLCFKPGLSLPHNILKPIVACVYLFPHHCSHFKGYAIAIGVVASDCSVPGGCAYSDVGYRGKDGVLTLVGTRTIISQDSILSELGKEGIARPCQS